MKEGVVEKVLCLLRILNNGVRFHDVLDGVHSFSDLDGIKDTDEVLL